MSARQALVYLGNLGAALPEAIAQHRGNFVLKRKDGAEDELYAGMRDSSGAMRLRRLLTREYADGRYFHGGDLTVGNLSVAGIVDDASSGAYTVAAGPAMGSSPGAITQAGNEYCGRLIQTTGASGTAAGILWTITFANPRPTANYNIFLNQQNAESARILAYAVNDSASQFTLRCQVAPGAGQQIRIGWWIVQR